MKTKLNYFFGQVGLRAGARRSRRFGEAATSRRSSVSAPPRRWISRIISPVWFDPGVRHWRRGVADTSCDEASQLRTAASKFGLKRAEARAPRRNESGMVTVLFIALLAIMMILVTAEARALIQLRREVKFLEQQQIKRLNGSPTNAVIIATSEVK